MKNISEFQNSWNFWIFGSWTQPGAWHMIVPFWSWNLSDTTHVRSHTKFQLIWAINTAFTMGGAESAPPSLKCLAGTPSLLGLKLHDCFFGIIQKVLDVDNDQRQLAYVVLLFHLPEERCSRAARQMSSWSRRPSDQPSNGVERRPGKNVTEV